MGRRRPFWRRLLSWPARRAYRALASLRRATWHGLSPPVGWPLERAWLFGPSHRYDGQQVTIYVGGRRYEFIPVTSGRRRGHMYRGRLWPNEAHLAERLAALWLDPAEARLLAAVSSVEGGFDSLQTYAQGRLAWGFVQFTATGGLPGLLQRLQALEPERFQRYFGAAGIGVEPGMLVVDAGGRRLRGWQAVNRLHDEPALWKPFLLAAEDPHVQDVQIRAAYENYLLRSRQITIRLGGESHRLGEVLAGHEVGPVVLLDRAVEGGLGYAARLFRRAARQVGPRSPAGADELLAAARKLEPHNHARWDAVQKVFAGSRAPAADLPAG